MQAALFAATLLGCLGAAVIGVRAMSRWPHLPRRFLFTGVGVAACLALGALCVDALLGGPRAGGWRAPPRLLADALLPLTFILLVQAYLRADRAALKAQEAALINQRTGLPNREALIGQAMPALARCQRDQAPASVIAAAVDGANNTSRHRGPVVAQEALREFATVFREATRAGDVPGHATSLVVAALLPSATPEATRAMAERLRRAAATRLPHPAMDGRRLTVSVGIAPVGDGPTRAVLDEAIAAAEAALAAAQAAGGDRVIEAPAPPLRSVGQPL